MTTRIIAVILAAVLAVVGTILLVGYVRGADERAFAGAELVQVLVVKNEIPAGSNGSTLGTAVDLKAVPAAYVAEGAVTDVADLAGLVATVQLVPGEQVLASRFVEPGKFGESGGSVAVPDGLQEISVAVDVQRVVGGSLVAGDLVGIYSSLNAEGDDVASTRRIETKVLVTAVAQGGGPQEEGAAPQGTILVNLAVTADQAQRIVYTAEFGRVYFAHESEGVRAPKSITTRESFPG